MHFEHVLRCLCTTLLAVFLSVSGVQSQPDLSSPDTAINRVEALLAQLDRILIKLETDIEETEIKMLLQPENAAFRGVLDGMIQRQTQLLSQQETLTDLLSEIRDIQGDDGAD